MKSIIGPVLRSLEGYLARSGLVAIEGYLVNAHDVGDLERRLSRRGRPGAHHFGRD